MNVILFCTYSAQCNVLFVWRKEQTIVTFDYLIKVCVSTVTV